MITHVRNRINLDITNRCSLKCSGCARQRFWDNGKNMPGLGDISIKSWEMFTDYFDEIGMCGQISDPTLHHDFHTLLKIAMKKNVEMDIHCAASYRSKEWYTQAFELTQGHHVEWVFGIDGLPKDSHKYRVNQDGEKLYEIMKTCAAMGHRTTWQYIPFNYNENDIDTCVQMAQDIGVTLKLLRSSRWIGSEHLLPKDESLYVKKAFGRWEIRYDLLKNFYSENGHSSIPSDYNLNLYKWSLNQRYKYRNNTLSENRINLLNEIEFVWGTEE